MNNTENLHIKKGNYILTRTKAINKLKRFVTGFVFDVDGFISTHENWCKEQFGEEENMYSYCTSKNIPLCEVLVGLTLERKNEQLDYQVFNFSDEFTERQWYYGQKYTAQEKIKSREKRIVELIDTMKKLNTQIKNLME